LDERGDAGKPVKSGMFHVKQKVVIWDGIPIEMPVIPAKAGIQSIDRAFPKVCRVDSLSRE
jgi:hypothetical protein